MNGANTIKNISQAALDPLETLNSQVAKPMLDEIIAEFGFGNRGVGSGAKTIGQEELARAREKQKIDQMKEQASEKDQKVYQKVQLQYREYAQKSESKQADMKEEYSQLQNEVAQLAKLTGVETKAHIGTMPKKVGILDIKHLSSIARLLRLKAQESKSAQDLVGQRSNAKPATGMLAWVSGKQMKVHEQGTLQLQG